jgi:hypothetical protein
MAQQTAVEWLQSLHKKGILIEKSFEMAKEMEKEQIINACEHFADYPFNEQDYQQYYNENYNK